MSLLCLLCLRPAEPRDLILLGALGLVNRGNGVPIPCYPESGFILIQTEKCHADKASGQGERLLTESWGFFPLNSSGLPTASAPLKSTHRP